MSHVYYYSCDGSGIDSVQDIIDANPKDLTAIEVLHFDQWDQHTQSIVPKIQKGDTVILDTITMFANSTRGDFKLGNDPSVLYWEKRNVYFSDKNYQTNYEAAGQMIMRRLKDLKNVGARIIVTAHEKEKEDQTVVPPIKRRGPDINDALLSNLVGSSSDVARLRVVFEDEFNGEKLRFKRGQRVLEFGPSEDYISKVHVGLGLSGKVPSVIIRPSYTKVCKALGKIPSWLTVYGNPGAGKSTFTLSSLIDPNGEGIGN
jgi:hypothetical protein